jgi:hypothetical protein
MTDGFDFWAISKRFWLKSSSDLMLRISRLGSMFAFFSARSPAPLPDGSGSRKSRPRRPPTRSADSIHSNVFAHLAHRPRRGDHAQERARQSWLHKRDHPAAEAAPCTARPYRNRIVNELEATLLQNQYAPGSAGPCGCFRIVLLIGDGKADVSQIQYVQEGEGGIVHFRGVHQGPRMSRPPKSADVIRYVPIWVSRDHRA